MRRERAAVWTLALLAAGCAREPTSPREIALDAPSVRIALAEGWDIPPRERLYQAGMALVERFGKPRPGSLKAETVRDAKIETLYGDASYATSTLRFDSRPGIVFRLVASEEGDGVCTITAPAAVTPAVMSEAFNRCMRELARGVSIPWTKESEAAALGAAAGPGPNWTHVAGVYFLNLPTLSPGADSAEDVKPVVLFDDGTFYRIANLPLEDVDLATERARHPDRFGRWTRSGDAFVLKADRRVPMTHTIGDDAFFPTFPATPGLMLSGRYDHMTRGEDLSPGDPPTVEMRDIRFFANGRFIETMRTDTETNCTTFRLTQGTGFRSCEGAGSYALDRHTVTLRFDDGRVERRFFAIGVHDVPIRRKLNTLFVGARYHSGAENYPAEVSFDDSDPKLIEQEEPARPPAAARVRGFGD